MNKPYYIKALLGISAVLLLLINTALYAQPGSNRLVEAGKAYNHFQLKQSREMYYAIIKDSDSKTADRVTALQKLAMQDWNIYKNYKGAAQKLDSAVHLKTDLSASLALHGDIDRQAGYFTLGKANALKAINQSLNNTDSINAQVIYTQAIYDGNIAALKAGRPLNKTDLLKSVGILNSVLNKQPGKPTPAQLLIGFCLLLQDGPGLFEAWKSFYFITTPKDINQVLVKPYNTLSRILPGWRNGRLSYADEKTLILAFSQSRFNDDAAIAAGYVFRKDKARLIADKEISLILQYQTFIKDIAKVNARFYPQVAQGLKDYEKQYDAAINAAAQRLWVKLGRANTIKNYNQDAFFKAIKEKFGTEGYIGSTVGYYGMLMGHIIHNEEKEISQYGYKAKFRYINIDRMISLDFTTWYGATNVGGWGDETTIYQVRRAYLNQPFERLSWVIDTAAKNKMLARIEKAKKEDIVRCKADPYADAAFLSLLITYNESVKLMDSLLATGLSKKEASSAFIAETMRRSIESTVFNHEGRHAIDQLFFKKEFDEMTDDERELRAKYSEVRFATNPKLAFTGSIFGGDLDVNTNHGKANQRFRKIIVDWMQQHSSEITGLDATMPLMIQFNLLTDAQIVKMCEEADKLSHK
jgi:hypothetical protein